MKINKETVGWKGLLVGGLFAVLVLFSDFYALTRVDSAQHFAFSDLGEISSVYIVRAGREDGSLDVVDGISQKRHELFCLEGATLDSFLTQLRNSSYRKLSTPSILPVAITPAGTEALATEDPVSYHMLLVGQDGLTRHVYTVGLDYIYISVEEGTPQYLAIATTGWGTLLDNLLSKGQLLETYFVPIDDPSVDAVPFPDNWSL